MNHEIELVDRFVALWNEPSAERRGTMVRELWTDDALHVFEPPHEVLDAAAGLSVTAVFQARGHAELEERVARAYQEFIAPGRFAFRLAGEPKRVADTVRFTWEMVSTDGSVAGVGLEFVVLAADGRIRLDYQFIES
jgi:hypothetical protein